MKDRRVRAVLAIAFVMFLFGRSREATSGIYYDPHCADLSGWEWVFEGCWWQS